MTDSGPGLLPLTLGMSFAAHVDHDHGASGRLGTRPGARNHGQKTGAARTFSQEPGASDTTGVRPATHRTLDLERFRPYVTDVYTKYFWLGPGSEHYKLLAHLSTCWNDATLIDLGTDKGCSALALSYNRLNRVISYDIEDRKPSPIDLPNIEFRVKDARDDRQDFLAAPLIVLDTAHDGMFEQQMYDMLYSADYEGLLLLDDIHLNTAMLDFWNGIGLEKFDLTSIGHYSGTGLVHFAHREPAP
jgi:hypothetical protein